MKSVSFKLGNDRYSIIAKVGEQYTEQGYTYIPVFFYKNEEIVKKEAYAVEAGRMTDVDLKAHLWNEFKQHLFEEGEQ